MDRNLLGHLPLVLAVAKRGGFAAAAGELGMSPSAVSHAIRLVEDRLGTPLFARTTRRVVLTEAGSRLVAGAGPALAELQAQLDEARGSAGRVGGLLRLNTPGVALPMIVTRIVKEAVERWPDLRIELFVDDGFVDIVEGGFDAGIRLGAMIAKDMVAVRLTPPFRAVVVGTPGYLQARGAPADIRDLREHACIGYRQISSGGLYRWELRDGERDVEVEAVGPLIVNDALYARELALQGLGLAYLLEPLVADDLAAGRLIDVLPAAAITEPGLFLYYPERATLAPKLRAFVDVAKVVAGAKRKRAERAATTTT
ncbi:MAG: LysR family transcriptional regulator [Pseudomonadota bacterium]